MAVLTVQAKEWIIDKLQNAAALSDANAAHVGWGTGAATEATVGASSTPFSVAGVTEAAEARVLGTLSQPGTAPNLTDRCVATITASGAKSITQAWRTNTATKGDAAQVMFIYAAFTAVPVETGDAIAFTFDYVQS